MQSLSFIKHASTLIDAIKNRSLAGSPDEQQSARDQMQKDINQLFGALQNPTLPSAYRLRDAALEAGFTVDPKVQHRLGQFENLS